MEFMRCYACMGELTGPGEVCPRCGFDNTSVSAAQPGHALPCGTVLAGHYLVGRVLGQGGFGISYIGWNLALEQPVCLKEYFPAGAMRSSGRLSQVFWSSDENAQSLKAGRDSFVKEARKAAKLSDLASVVKVSDVFFENDTAYIAMNYVRGETLKSHILKRGQPLEEKACLELLRPVMEDLLQVHTRGIIHRDISPDNLMLTDEGRLVLLDLGAAKDLSGGSGQSSVLVAKQGFSPIEQYSQHGSIGPWTDVYAMCATLVWCVSGRLLPTPMDRLNGESIELSAFTPATGEALEKGLAIQPGERLQSMEELLDALENGVNGPVVWHGSRYQDAVKLMEERQYDAAGEIFASLGSYRNSSELAEQCRDLLQAMPAQERGGGDPATSGPEESGQRAVPTPRSRRKGAGLIGFLIAAVLISSAAGGFLLLQRSKAPQAPGLVMTPNGASAASENGKAHDLLEQGSRCLDAGDYVGAMSYFQKAADAGSAAGMTNLGYLYMKGLGVERDYAVAMDCFEKGAAAGDSTAMFWIGWCYYYRLGVERDWSTALEWCLKSAEAGNAEAMHWVSDMYRYGQGTPVDLDKAEDWRQKALDAGYTE